MKGFAATSRIDRPNPTRKFVITNAGNEVNTAAGQKTRVPHENMAKPTL